MAKCRFFPECARCNEVGDSWFPCEGGADGTRCADYAPMPDVEALLALADELEEDACWEVQTPGDTSGAWRLKDTCDRIREALGVGGNEEGSG